MKNIWDIKADAVQKGDKLRDVSPYMIELKWMKMVSLTMYSVN